MRAASAAHRYVAHHRTARGYCSGVGQAVQRDARDDLAYVLRQEEASGQGKDAARARRGECTSSVYALLCIGRQYKLPECIEINTLVAVVELEDADLAAIQGDYQGTVRQKMASGSRGISMPDSNTTSMRKLSGDACNTLYFLADAVVLH